MRTATSVLFVGLFVLTFAPTRAWCDELPVYTAHRMAGPVVIDGKLDEAAWRRLPCASGFRVLGAGESFAQKQTSFRVGWDDAAVYVAVTCQEPFMGEVQASLPDGGPLWLEDSVEIFLAPNHPNYQQFVVSAIGSRTWVRGGADWRSAGHKGTDAWTVEVRVPLESLGLEVKPGDRWRLNIARDNPTHNQGERNTTWGPLRGGFHDMPRFGHLVFAGTSLGQADAGRVTAEYRRKRLGPILKPLARLLRQCEQQLADTAGNAALGLTPARQAELRTVADRLKQVIADPDASHDDFTRVRQKAVDVLDRTFRTKLGRLLGR